MKSILLILPLAAIFAYSMQSSTTPVIIQPPTCNAAATALPLEVPEGFLFQSADEGKTWQPLGGTTAPDKLSAITRFIAHEGALFSGGENGVLYEWDCHNTLAFWKEHDVDGADKQGLISGIYSTLSGLYVCMYESGFYRKKKDSEVWVEMGKTLDDKIVYSIAETKEGAIVVAAEKGIYTSTDDAQTWTKVLGGGPFFGMAINGQTWIAANAQEGLARSTDNGKTWSYTHQDMGGAYNINPISGGFAALRVGEYISQNNGAKAQRSFISMDDGNTWNRLNEGTSLGKIAKWDKYAFVSKTFLSEDYTPDEPHIQDLEASNNSLLSSHKNGISRSTNNGKTWELVLPYQPEKDDEPIRFELVKMDGKIFAMKIWDGC